MWIDNNISKPLRKGYYKTLVDWDGLGTLQETENELFNGNDWCHFKSSRQFIRFWWAEKEDYKTITDKIQPEIENIEIGVYILNKIKVGETYTITHLEDKEPKIEKNEK